MNQILEYLLHIEKEAHFHQPKHASFFFCTFLILVNPVGGAGFSVKDNHIKVLS